MSAISGVVTIVLWSTVLHWLITWLTMVGPTAIVLGFTWPSRVGALLSIVVKYKLESGIVLIVVDKGMTI